MKVCLLCGETYSDPIDFCFRDGEVLAASDFQQTTPARARTESFSATPGLVTAAAVVEDDEPEVTRANRRALMRAAAAAYLVTEPPHAGEVEPAENGAGELPPPDALVVSPFDQAMPELPWPLEEEEVVEEPARSSMFAAALIGSLVVVAAALGAGLLVLVGLGQRTAEVPASGTFDASTSVAPASAVRDRDAERAPTPRAVGTGETSRSSAPGEVLAAPAPAEPAPGEGASDFFVVLGDDGTHGPDPLVLYVDGVRAGVVPVTVRLTPGEHTFRVTTDTSGAPMFEVRRTVESPGDPTTTGRIDLSD